MAATPRPRHPASSPDAIQPRRGYAKGRAKREEILDRALELFGEVGYNSASLREIAARCGITHPGLLHHFPSKADLLAAVLQRRDEVDLAELLPQEGTIADYLDGMVRLITHNTSTPHMVELYTVLCAEATTHDHPARLYFQERYRTLSREVAQELRRGIEAGRVRPDVDPERAAIAIMALMDGLQVQWLLEPGRVDMPGIVRDALADLLIHQEKGGQPSGAPLADQPTSEPAISPSTP